MYLITTVVESSKGSHTQTMIRTNPEAEMQKLYRPT